jgi:hypothetical protein
MEIAIEDLVSKQNLPRSLFACKPWQFQNFRLNVETVTLFRQQDIVGFKIIPNQVTPMPLLPHCQLQQRKPTNGFVDLRKPTSNSGNNTNNWFSSPKKTKLYY